jgi:hypothetical protein
MNYALSDHAKTVIADRRIEISWLDATLSEPTRTEPDATDADLEHRLSAIPERDGRVLRVIINTTCKPVRVVTAYFDRAMRNKL